MSTLKVDTIDTSNSSGNITVSRPLAGSGASLTALNATQLTSGTIPIARIADDAITLAKMAGGTDGQIITYDASGNPVAVGPGTDGQVLTSTGAGSPPAFEAASGGALRNFWIDGALTQWPDGTAASAGTGYKSALCKVTDGSSGSLTAEKSTSVPTAAAAGFQGGSSLLVKCTGTEASMTAANYTTIDLFVTGSDFAPLHQQQMTFSFWAKTAAANASDNYNVAFMNGAPDRNYIFTFSPTATWTKFTFTFTGDTSGSWLFTEHDKGMRVRIALASGTDYDNGTEGSWTAGANQWSSSGTAISNFMDSTSNEFYITQIQLVLGATSPDFTSPPISTIKQQVGFYVEDLIEHEGYGGATARMMGSGFFNDGDSFWISIHYTSRKRKIPIITHGSNMQHYSVTWEGSANYAEAFNQITHISKVACAIHAELDNTNATHGGYGALLHAINTAAFFLVDARH